MEDCYKKYLEKVKSVSFGLVFIVCLIVFWFIVFVVVVLVYLVIVFGVEFFLFNIGIVELSYYLYFVFKVLFDKISFLCICGCFFDIVFMYFRL